MRTTTITTVDTIPADAAVGDVFDVVRKVVEIIAGGRAFSDCARCLGSGQHGPVGIYDGRCFDCGGVAHYVDAAGRSRYGTSRSIAEENKLARARMAAGKRRDAKAAARSEGSAARFAAIVAERPAIAIALTWYDASTASYDEINNAEGPRTSGLGRADGFVSDLRHYDFHVPTWKLDAIVEAVEAVIDGAAAEMAAAHAAPAPEAPVGTVEVTGTIVSLKWVEGDYGSTPKMLVTVDDGWKVYVTAPRAVFDLVDEVVGARVSFTAALSAGRDGDPQFRIGKRPRGMRVTG